MRIQHSPRGTPLLWMTFRRMTGFDNRPVVEQIYRVPAPTGPETATRQEEIQT